MLEKIYKLIIAFLAALPLQHYVMPLLLRYVNAPTSIGQFIMYLMVGATIYELLITYKKWKKYDKILISFIYYITLAYVLFARPDMEYAFYELDPYQLVNSIRYGSYDEWIVALFNILLFIPMPIIHNFYNKRKNVYNLGLSISIGFLVELIQVVSHRGVFDIGDIILYCVGIVIGMLLKEKIR